MSHVSTISPLKFPPLTLSPPPFLSLPQLLPFTSHPPMALIQFSLSPASVRSSPAFPCCPSHPITTTSSSSVPSRLSKSTAFSRSLFSVPSKGENANVKGTNKWAFAVNSSNLDTAGPTATVGQVTEVTKDTFWPIVNSAADKTVVLDMYTQWCGPCKVIAPKFQELSKKYDDVVFLKLDCNQENKPLAKELGIKVVPTFKILKGSKIVKEVTGAKFDDLVFAIETVRSQAVA